jgi:hypothetical protein
MGTFAMYVPSFIKTGSGIQKLMGGGIYRHRQDGDRISLLRESRLKTFSKHNKNEICFEADPILEFVILYVHTHEFRYNFQTSWH